MLGRKLTELDDMSKIKLARSESGESGEGETRLQATELGRAGAIEPFDLELHAGEVLGLAGLLGSGRTEVADLLFGVETPDTGTVQVNGTTVEHFSPLRSIGRGIALCPEDRKADGIVG